MSAVATTYRGKTYGFARIGGGSRKHLVEVSWLELAERGGYRVMTACGRRGKVTSTSDPGMEVCQACVDAVPVRKEVRS